MWIIPAAFSLIFIGSGFSLLMASGRMLDFVKGKFSKENMPIGGIPKGAKPIHLRALGGWFIFVGCLAATMTVRTFG